MLSTDFSAWMALSSPGCCANEASSWLRRSAGLARRGMPARMLFKSPSEMAPLTLADGLLLAGVWLKETGISTICAVSRSGWSPGTVAVSMKPPASSPCAPASCGGISTKLASTTSCSAAVSTKLSSSAVTSTNSAPPAGACAFNVAASAGASPSCDNTALTTIAGASVCKPASAKTCATCCGAKPCAASDSPKCCCTVATAAGSCGRPCCCQLRCNVAASAACVSASPSCKPRRNMPSRRL